MVKIVNSDDVINFGKYRGKTWGYVASDDPQYIVWAENNIDSIKFNTGFLDSVMEYLYENDDYYQSPLSGQMYY